MKIFSTWWNIFFLHDKMFLMMFNLHATLWMRWGKETVARLRPYPIQIFRTKRVKESEYDSFHYQKAFLVIFESIKLWLTKVWFNLFPCFVQGNIILYPCTVFITKSQKSWNLTNYFFNFEPEYWANNTAHSVKTLWNMFNKYTSDLQSHYFTPKGL